MRFLRSFLLNAVVVVAYYIGVDALFYWLNRHAKKILVFHNVLPDELCRTGLVNDTVMKLSDFEKVVGWLKGFSFSTDCLDPRTLTLTFDDGYHNQYEYAFKTLRKKGIPMVCFAAKDAAKILNIDKLLLWVTEAPVACIPGGDRRRYWYDVLCPKYRSDGAARGENVVRECEATYSLNKILAALPAGYVRERFGSISNDEECVMRAQGSVIACHTKSHFPLSMLIGDELCREMKPEFGESRECFSYPFGSEQDVSDEAIELVESLGYPCAVSNIYFTRNPHRSQSRYFLPRISVDSVSRCRLHYALSGFRYFLITHKLFPRTSNLI